MRRREPAFLYIQVTSARMYVQKSEQQPPERNSSQHLMEQSQPSTGVSFIFLSLSEKDVFVL